MSHKPMRGSAVADALPRICRGGVRCLIGYRVGVGIGCVVEGQRSTLVGMGSPETRYARSADVMIAYQVVGNGPFDVVLTPGTVSHVELYWEVAGIAALLRGLAEQARLIFFDKRGTGLSDRVPGAPTLEERSDDIRAVMDAAGSRRAVLFGASEGVPMSVVFAASYPERVSALVLYGGQARELWAPDYLFGSCLLYTSPSPRD